MQEMELIPPSDIVASGSGAPLQPLPDRHAWKRKEEIRRPYIICPEYKPGSVTYNAAGGKYMVAPDGSLRRDGDWKVGKRKAIELGLRKSKKKE
jgi:hypothetical protein